MSCSLLICCCHAWAIPYTTTASEHPHSSVWCALQGTVRCSSAVMLPGQYPTRRQNLSTRTHQCGVRSSRRAWATQQKSAVSGVAFAARLPELPHHSLAPSRVKLSRQDASTDKSRGSSRALPEFLGRKITGHLRWVLLARQHRHELPSKLFRRAHAQTSQG